ncbi:hypothetical protein H6P81_005679 [Aristolochia fimbriata]|uniref:Uncharacterized protein n=1 Tax=Aristolochia fimbriata TaxID=158543 RepID=A0AAV7EV45_ARIFI|nr:hypothetical protein H6P81_005679 [Aristolochia fimbriata]
MSIIQYPEAINADNLLSPSQKLGLLKCPSKDAQNLQVWNNAAFDDDESTVRTSWMQPPLLEIKSSKENQSPNLGKSWGFDEPPAPNKNPSLGKPPKLLFKQGYLDAAKNRGGQVDEEIDEIEKEIAKLRERLEALRIQKKNQNPANDEATVAGDDPAKIPAKKSLKTPKKIEELTPAANSRRRGVSLGPAEILGSVRSRPTETPQSRRKSFFWKLPGIEEEERADKKGAKKTQKSVGSSRSLSLSPKSRAAKTADPRRGISTVGAKKPVKKDDTAIQPKKLFPERPAGAQKPGRVVASRYNQIPPRVAGNSPVKDRRRGSIPETDKKDNGRKSRGAAAPSVADSGTRRRWDIPEGPSPPPVADIAETLPKIRTSRIVNESPRDSGCAKRVADLVGKKTFFGGDDGEVVTSLCQVLEFEEEE